MYCVFAAGQQSDGAAPGRRAGRRPHALPRRLHGAELKQVRAPTAVESLVDVAGVLPRVVSRTGWYRVLLPIFTHTCTIVHVCVLVHTG